MNNYNWIASAVIAMLAGALGSTQTTLILERKSYQDKMSAMADHIRSMEAKCKAP